MSTSERNKESPTLEDLSIIAQEGLLHRPAELDPLEQKVLERIQNNGVSNMYRVREALGIMYYFEGEEKRQDNVNYAASHQLEVMQILADAGIADEQVYIIASLHDTPENTAPNKNPHETYGSVLSETLGAYFKSDRIGKSIDSLSRVKKINDADMNDETYLKLFRSLIEDPGVVLIKLADRLHNLRTISPLSRDKQDKKANETLDIYVKLAFKLGLNDWGYELAARSLAILYHNPSEDNTILADILSNYQSRYSEEFLNHVYTVLKSLNPYSQSLPLRIESVAALYPPLLTNLILGEVTPLQKEAFRFLWNHFILNSAIMDPASNKYVIPFDVVIPVTDEDQFEIDVHTMALNFKKVKDLNFVISSEQIFEAFRNQRDGVVALNLENLDGLSIQLRFMMVESAIKTQAGITEQYVLHPQTDYSQAEYAKEKLRRLQESMRRIDVTIGDALEVNGQPKQKRRYANDIVREFRRTLELDSVQVFSPIQAEFIFSRGAKVIDYAYAAGFSYGNRAVSANIYLNNELIEWDVPLNYELRDGVMVELNLTEHETIDANFVHRLDITSSEFTKESIAERIKHQMKAEELLVETHREKDASFDFNQESTPATIWVWERGFYFIEEALNGKPGTLPDMPFFGAGYANPYGNDLNRELRDRFKKFIEEVGLSKIEPEGRRKDYFRKKIEQILTEQGNMLVIEVDVDDQPKALAAITSLFGKEKINIMYNSSRPDPHEMRGRKISQVRIVIESGNGNIFRTKIRPKIEAKGWKVTLPPTKIRNYKYTPTWVTLFPEK